MQKFQDVVLDSQGRPVAGAVIAVQEYPGGDAATVYQTNEIGTAYVPTTDDLGAFYFYAPDGNYSYTVTVAGVLRKTVTDVQIVDTINALTGKASLTGATFTGVVSVPLGSVSLPSYTFSGDTNTGIYSPGANQLALVTSGVRRVIVDESGNIGINTPTPAARFEVGRLGVAQTIPNLNAINTILTTAGGGTSASGTGITLAGGNASFTAVFFGDTDDGQMGALIYDHSTNSLQIRVNGVTEGLRIDSSRRVLVGITSANTSGAKFQTVDGITFPATQVSSSDANTLDDYEEGNFTPVLIGLTVAGTGTYITQSGRYTKIGRQVTIAINIVISGHTGSGDMQITGLPFAPAAIFSPLAVRANNLALTAGNYLQAYCDDSSTGSVIWLEQVPTGGGTSIPVPMDTAFGILLSGSYIT